MSKRLFTTTTTTTATVILFCVVCILAARGCTSSNSSSASNAGQAHFKSPQAAVDALVDALRAYDTAQLKQIFGPDSDEIVSSGDAVSDHNQADRFLAAYDKQHRLEADPKAGGTTLIIGDKDWPFPVPIVKADGDYVWDTLAGKDEILNRRIGRNELETEQVCLAIVDAEREYAQRKPMGGDLNEYAQKLISDPGKKNGLYWPTKEGEDPSPLGPLAAEASEEGYAAARQAARAAGEAPPPYHGYYYKLLTSQGSHANGGVTDYLVNGHLIGGFAVIAWPAQYGNSGIMTFMTNHDGIVYQRDLGPDTAKAVQSINTFDPDSQWKPTSVPPPTTNP